MAFAECWRSHERDVLDHHLRRRRDWNCNDHLMHGVCQMSEHTSGPWFIKETSKGYDILKSDHPRDLIAILAYRESWAVEKANAHLIAAAPDLKEFAESVLIYSVEGETNQLWVSYATFQACVPTNSPLGSILLNIEAARQTAIAKATNT